MANRKKTTLGVVHVTATPPSLKLTSSSLRNMHKARGFSDIGYNEWIDKGGTLYVGRGVEAIGAHVAGFNSISYGIALEGGVNAKLEADFTTITSQQLVTLERRMKEITKKYPKIKWCGHRDLSPDKDGDGIIEPHEWLKECPCFDAIPWAEARGLPGADIKGTWKVIKLPSDRDPQAVVEVYEGPDTRTAYLQRLLTKAGFPVGDDGILGDKTGAAIKAFQLVHGLKQTATFDVETTKLLRELIEAPQAKVVMTNKQDLAAREKPEIAVIITAPPKMQRPPRPQTWGEWFWSLFGS